MAAFAIGTIGRRGPEQLLDGTTGKITNTFALPVLAAPTLHIAGVILILAGLLGLLLPPLARGPLKPDRLRRWARPGQPDAYDQAPTG